MMAKSVAPAFVSAQDGNICRVIENTITIKVSSEQTNGAYALCEDVTPPGAGASLHVHHREEEMFYVLEGEFEFQCGERVFQAGRGALAALPRHIPHAFKNVGKASAKALLLAVPGGLEKVFQEVNTLPPGPPDIPKIVAIFKKGGVDFLPPAS